jgi:hypothetical protein
MNFSQSQKSAVTAGLLSLLVCAPALHADTLEKGRHEWGVSSDYISNLSKRRTNVRFLAINGEYGYFKTARREYLVSASVMRSSTPSTSTSFAGTLLWRQHLLTNGKVIPYDQVGAGLLYNGIATKELQKGFQFQERAGIGLRFFINKNASINLEAGAYHVSNADLRLRNVGFNTGYIAIGYNRFF